MENALTKERNQRLVWVDQARGLAIFLVVYGHNYPDIEPYIYSFHVPLFFLISGMFHPKNVTFGTARKRVKLILTPYFIWASILFLFWLLIGRFYGQSALKDLSPLKNLFGIFYAQGGQEFMDWGIPMWFLPCIFVVFLLFSAINEIRSPLLLGIALIATVFLGFTWNRVVGVSLPWSLNLAPVAVGFYALGNLIKPFLMKLSKLHTVFIALAFLTVHLFAFSQNRAVKIDFYRAVFGNEFWFFLSGLMGALFYVMFFKLVPVFSLLSYIGKHTIVILATHLKMLTVIKMAILLLSGSAIFAFTEIERLGIAVLQIILAMPIIWAINKYTPILNGKTKTI
ncbi:MAG: acyltransferase family protein [Leeuwenhoekiella sp.]